MEIMNRRYFLSSSTKAAAGVALAPVGRAFAQSANVRIRISTQHIGRAIPPDFTGLGYEISSVAKPGLLSARNKPYIQLVRNLGRAGIFRIGGNTSDSASYKREGDALSAPRGTVVNSQCLVELKAFLDATQWRAIWGLNLGTGSVQAAVAEAAAVSSVLKTRLHSFEIGNEPDLFHGGPRPREWDYGAYLTDFRRYKAAIRAKLPQAHFSGPDVAGATSWVERFAKDEGSDLSLLTEHYYRGNGESDLSTIALMLHRDQKLEALASRLEGIAAAAQVPYRICETNSFYNGGRAGVSDTFGSALWVLDYMFTLCSAGSAGVNMQTGVNHRGFISYYSPIAEDTDGRCSAAPEYYGMLAFAQGSDGKQIPAVMEDCGINLTAYAVARDEQRIVLTVINRDQVTPANVMITCNESFVESSTLIRLQAPSVESTNGVTLGGAEVMPDGRWLVRKREPVRVEQGNARIEVQCASAALISLKTRSGQ